MKGMFVLALGFAFVSGVAAIDDPPAKAQAPAPKQAPKSTGYVGCSQTKIFHKPSCHYVKDIEKNGTKVDFTKRPEAVQAGYKPCDECKP